MSHGGFQPSRLGATEARGPADLHATRHAGAEAEAHPQTRLAAGGDVIRSYHYEYIHDTPNAGGSDDDSSSSSSDGSRRGRKKRPSKAADMKDTRKRSRERTTRARASIGEDLNLLRESMTGSHDVII